MLQVAQEAAKKPNLCVIQFRIHFSSCAAVPMCSGSTKSSSGWGFKLSSYLFLEFLTFLTWLWRLFLFSSLNLLPSQHFRVSKGHHHPSTWLRNPDTQG